MPVTVDRAEAFARAVLELDPVARLALAVLDGGLFAGARLVELAAAVVGAAGAAGTSGGDADGTNGASGTAADEDAS